jgi:hypothetical protein
VCYILCTFGFVMLIQWSSYWLGHPHTFITVRSRLLWEIRAGFGMGFRVVVVACGLWPAGMADLFRCCVVPGQGCHFGGKLDL